MGDKYTIAIYADAVQLENVDDVLDGIGSWGFEAPDHLIDVDTTPRTFPNVLEFLRAGLSELPSGTEATEIIDAINLLQSPVVVSRDYTQEIDMLREKNQ